MGFEIVDAASVERSHRGRARHLAGAALGTVLVAAAALAAVPLLFVVAAFAVLWIAGNRPDTAGVDAQLLVFLGASALVSFTLWKLGVRLVRGRRGLALFLRRFGFGPATDALTHALGGSLGHRWRLVTLDDHEIAPIGVRSSRRWLIRLTRLAMVAAAGAATVYAVNKLSGDSIGAMIDKLFRETHDNAVEQGQNQVGAAIGALFATLIVGIVLIGLLMIVVISPIALAGAGALFASLGTRSIRRAEHAKAIVIEHRDRIDRGVQDVVRRTRKVLAPRMVVARVATPIWQDVVASFVDAGDIVVVDVSEASDNLLWELDLLRRTSTAWVAVGRVDQLNALRSATSAAADGVRHALEGRRVIGYTDADSDALSDALTTLMSLR